MVFLSRIELRGDGETCDRGSKRGSLYQTAAIAEPSHAVAVIRRNSIRAEGVPVHILWIIVIGFFAGVIARLLAPGPNNPTGFILTMVLGVVGAFLATFVGQAVGWYRPDQGAGLIGAVIGALVVLFVWHRLVASRTIDDPGVRGRRWL
jgi:uncharacterized membrane protein YeaQ/YmgE (transglycosylase-associated protein family)